MQYSASAPDLVCLCHLRWNFVFQRPQHLMVRFARHRRVFFVEEPLYDATEPWLAVAANAVRVVTPHLPAGLPAAARISTVRTLLKPFYKTWNITKPVVWLYTPLAWPLVSDLEASAVVYDCMDELSGFAGASPDIRARERELMGAADVMFTGGHSLFEAKRGLHPNIYPFPSSVDTAHFSRARTWQGEPEDQEMIPHPRIGFCGVIDERMNLGLIGELAAGHPDWHFVMVGPVAKIDPAMLPHAANIHYLGMKPYDALPSYFAGWDVAFMPFAHNAATRYISPTKTPEYLAAGCPVVSTSIRDVVKPYGERGLVDIADTADACGAAIERLLAGGSPDRQARADALLATQSWDRTWAAMNALVSEAEAPTTETGDHVTAAAKSDAQPLVL